MFMKREEMNVLKYGGIKTNINKNQGKELICHGQVGEGIYRYSIYFNPYIRYGIFVLIFIILSLNRTISSK